MQNWGQMFAHLKKISAHKKYYSLTIGIQNRGGLKCTKYDKKEHQTVGHNWG